MEIIRIFFRILSFPFFTGILILSSLKHILFHMYWFLRYGGEHISYNKKVNPNTIMDAIVKVMPKTQEELKKEVIDFNFGPQNTK